ncbi:MAG TPA: B12-binding domain-containing radical SAM protein [Paludibacter sp.]|nr:B12-binding domain-containing radical SAM protein [Paludibacter sp.]
MEKTMPKILLTSPCGPYPKLPIDKDPVDYFYYRNTYRQRMFQLRSFQSWHSLHFLAQNIAVDSVVLENPSFARFQKEVNEGKYELIAIGFTIPLTAKVLEMAKWIKETHPTIEIILGGYGTAIFKESYDISNRLKSLVDRICFGDGNHFMNNLIREKWGIENHRPIKQDLIPLSNSFFRTRIELFKQIVLVSGLGCIYGCSFCATSSQFNKKYIPFFNGQQLFENLHQQFKKHPDIQSAIIYDEDFLHHRKRVLEFTEHFQNSEIKNSSFLLTVFASVQSIKKYTIEEIVACGIGTIFIGVESLSDEVLSTEGLVKRKGEITEIFEHLHSHGINTLGSLVIGWDSQTEELAKADASQFIALNPTFYQVIPLHVIPGTKLWEDMKLENRISDKYSFDLDGISEMNFDTKTFSHSEALKLVFSTYSGLVHEGGPWPFRLFENLMKGYLTLKNNSNPLLQNRARIYKSMIFPVCMLAFSTRAFFNGKGFRQKWVHTMKLFAQNFPLKFIFSLIISPLVTFLLAGIYIYGNLKFTLSKNGDQPEFIRKEYKT